MMNNFFKLTALLSIVLLSSAFSFSDLFAGKKYQELNNAEFAQLVDSTKTIIIDVRRVDEWMTTGIIKDSKLLTLFDAKGRTNPDFIKKIRLLPKHANIVFVCKIGVRSEQAAKFLTKELGFTKVYNLDNGIMRWKQHNKPVVASTQGTKL